MSSELSTPSDKSGAKTVGAFTPHLISNSFVRTVPIIVTAALVIVLVRACRWQNVVELWQYSQPAYLLLVFALLSAAAGFGGASLLVLLGRTGRLGFSARFMLDYFYIQSLCQLTPAQAAEIALPYVAGRGRFAPGEIAASLVVQRMTAFWLIMLVASWGADRWIGTGVLWVAAGLGALGSGTATALISATGVRRRVNDFVGRYFGSILAGFYETWCSFFRERRTRLAAHVALMAVRLLAVLAAGYASLQAFGIEAPFWLVSAAMAVAMLASMLPISLNGIGVVEGILVAALAGRGFGVERVLAASLAGRIISLVSALGWAGLYWFVQRRRGNSVPPGSPGPSRPKACGGH